jgi:hypothetical protein
MRSLSFKRHRFPADVIRYSVWLYFRFTLSFRDVEELLAQRGIEISYETIRCWTIKFGPLIARNLKRRRPAPTGRPTARTRWSSSPIRAPRGSTPRPAMPTSSRTRAGRVAVWRQSPEGPTRR